MWRRCAIAVAGLAFVAGCGLIETVKTAQFPWAQSGATSRTFDATVAAVIQAVTEASGVEVVLKKVDWNQSIQWPNGQEPPIDEESRKRLAAEMISMGIAGWTGETKDGQRVMVWIKPLGDRKKTEATILIGHQGDPELSRAFLDRVADKLAHPAPPQGDPAPKESVPSPAPKPDDSQPSTQGGPGR